jgi:putative phosphoesterase
MTKTETTSAPVQPDLREIRIGVIADTHIPDRVTGLHPDILPIFRSAGVSTILHAGDISANWVLSRLGEVAPVIAVRGNRDFLAGRLKLVEQLNLNGVSVALMHGHGGWIPYLKDKVNFYRDGYQLDRYLDLLVESAEEAKVVIFGHTHHPVIHQYKGKLILNPGSASFGPVKGELPTVGLLHIAAGKVRPEIIPLHGWKIREHKWVQG